MKYSRGLRLRMTGILAVGTWAALSAAGCGTEPESAITQPPPPLPVPVPTPTIPSFTISGTVFEHTASGSRPAAGVAVHVLSEDDVVATTDAAGRYSAVVRGDIVRITPLESSDYDAPCPSGSTWVSSNPNRPFDVHIVLKSVLATSGMPDSYPISAIFVSGTIIEATFGDGRPIAGVSVALGDEHTISYSTTLTDSLGRYLLCTAPPGVGTDQLMQLSVAKDGYYSASELVLGGSDELGVNLALLRSR
jgi:hypothetical protein